MRKLFINNIEPRTNYTQLHQLEVWGSAESSFNGVRSGATGSFSFNSIFIDKKALCKLY